ncbi:MAG: histidinol dehydrogenase [Promethearchaeota archaeon]
MVFDIKIISGKEFLERGPENFIPRTITEFESIKESVQKIINDVRANGDSSLIKYTEKYDSIKLSTGQIKVSKETIKEAYKLVPKRLIEAILVAKQNIEKFHKAQLRKEWEIEIIKGVKAGQIYRPIESVGVYIPGGRAVYPSTVLMTVIPARVAGVNRVVLCSPPNKIKISNRRENDEDKSYIGIHPSILVAANECGVDEIYQIGSAWAIAALAYGTETIKSVLKIIGPGNKYVNVAKMLVKDIVSIDTQAGPSEIAILADDTVNPSFIAYDLVSQVEHGPDNVGILVCNSSKLIDEVMDQLPKVISASDRKQIILESLTKYGLIIQTENILESINVVNEIAPEHLEIMTAEPRKVLLQIKNAGAIFLGEYSPVPLGDYVAGTNHVLPTGGSAKRISGLNVWEYLKIIDVLECKKEGVVELEKYLSPIAEFEGLLAHKEAVKRRLYKENH